MDPFCYVCVFVMLTCLFLAALWWPAEKDVTSWLSCMWCFCHVLIWCPVSGVVFDCIDSWSLSSSLLQLFLWILKKGSQFNKSYIGWKATDQSWPLVVIKLHCLIRLNISSKYHNWLNLCYVYLVFVIRGHLLGKGWPHCSCCDVYCVFFNFPCGILGQVWYLIVSFPDLWRLSYFQQLSINHLFIPYLNPFRNTFDLVAILCDKVKCGSESRST